MELAEKIPQKELRNLKKRNNEKPQSYIELFTEIMKNLEELKAMTKSRKYYIQQKSFKARENPKILKEHSPLLNSEKTQHKGLPNAIINDAKYVI